MRFYDDLEVQSGPSITDHSHAYQSTIIYKNETGMEVGVIDRVGLPLVLKSRRSGGSYNRNFIIQVTKLIDQSEVEVDPLGTFLGKRAIETPEYKAWVESITDAEDTLRVKIGQTRLTVSYKISREVLSREGVVYIPELDLAITGHPDVEANLAHPYSESMIAKKLMTKEILMQGHRTIGVTNLLIYNGEEPIKRYINDNGIALELISQPNQSLTEGLYIYVNGTGYNQEDKIVDNAKFKTIKEAEEEGILFGNKEDALARGDILGDLKRKEAIMAQQRKIEQQEHDSEMAAIKRKNELEDLEMTRKNNILQSELQAAKLREKDKLDERNDERKHLSDVLKWIPIILTTVTTIVTIVDRVQNSNKN